jgi:hypothetical protein
LTCTKVIENKAGGLLKTATRFSQRPKPPLLTVLFVFPALSKQSQPLDYLIGFPCLILSERSESLPKWSKTIEQLQMANTKTIYTKFLLYIYYFISLFVAKRIWSRKNQCRIQYPLDIVEVKIFWKVTTKSSIPLSSGYSIRSVNIPIITSKELYFYVIMSYAWPVIKYLHFSNNSLLFLAYCNIPYMRISCTILHWLTLCNLFKLLQKYKNL